MIQLDAIQLPDGLLWPDEYASQAVAQTVKRTLDGSPVVFYSGLSKGREITLESGQDTGWLTKTQVEAVKLLADSPGGVYTLTLRGIAYEVMFRHHDAPAFDAQPVIPFQNPEADDFYIVRIKLLTV